MQASLGLCWPYRPALSGEAFSCAVEWVAMDENFQDNMPFACGRCGEALTVGQVAQSLRRIEELAARIVEPRLAVVVHPMCPNCFEGLEELLTHP